jgi:hypothetical protein
VLGDCATRNITSFSASHLGTSLPSKHASSHLSPVKLQCNLRSLTPILYGRMLSSLISNYSTHTHAKCEALRRIMLQRHSCRSAWMHVTHTFHTHAYHALLQDPSNSSFIPRCALCTTTTSGNGFGQSPNISKPRTLSTSHSCALVGAWWCRHAAISRFSIANGESMLSCAYGRQFRPCQSCNGLSA